jgi:hypothetical protein
LTNRNELNWDVDFYKLNYCELPLNLEINISLENFPIGFDSYDYEGSKNTTTYIYFYCKPLKEFIIEKRVFEKDKKIIFSLPKSALNVAWKNSEATVKLSEKNPKNISFIMIKQNIGKNGTMRIKNVKEMNE